MYTRNPSSIQKESINSSLLFHLLIISESSNSCSKVQRNLVLMMFLSANYPLKQFDIMHKVYPGLV